MDSKLQIISGAHRGRKLYLPTGARPTQNMARVALFNMLASILPNNEKLVIWDAFAGSGAFGLEFLSRVPSAKVIFSDIAPDTVNKNLRAIGTAATVKQTDAIAAVAQFGADADVVFIDPPYSDPTLGARFVRKLTPIAKAGAILIWEFEKVNGAPEISEEWEILRDKTYGRARFLILRRTAQ